MEERFHNLFSGLQRAHGRFRIKATPSGKQQGISETIREGATPELWKQHLNAEYGLGIVPITDDRIVNFGAIDIDDRNINHVELEKQIKHHNLPLIICRSKSGGAHLFLFCKELNAEFVRNTLMDWVILLGRSGDEVFPKQVMLANENDVGNWLNMPYYGGETSTRYAIKDGERIGPEEFLDYAESKILTEEEFTNLKIVSVNEMFDGLLEEAPPCLFTLGMIGIKEGQRNKAMLNMGIYAKKRHGDRWKDHIEDLNRAFFDPKLSHDEIQNTIIKSLGKQNYDYTCKDTPICNYCSRQICLTKKYGVGDGKDDPNINIESLTKIETDPPTWIVTVNGFRMQCSTPELMDQKRFHRRCIDELTLWPDPIKVKTWGILMRGLINTARDLKQIKIPPLEATPQGQMKVLLKKYCTERGSARTQEELLMDKPWTNNGHTYFSATHFKQWLESQRMRVSQKDLWMWCHKLGAKKQFFNIKGSGINTWKIPSFNKQNEEFDVPDMQRDDMF